MGTQQARHSLWGAIAVMVRLGVVWVIRLGTIYVASCGGSQGNANSPPGGGHKMAAGANSSATMDMSSGMTTGIAGRGMSSPSTMTGTSTGVAGSGMGSNPSTDTMHNSMMNGGAGSGASMMAGSQGTAGSTGTGTGTGGMSQGMAGSGSASAGTGGTMSQGMSGTGASGTSGGTITMANRCSSLSGTMHEECMMLSSNCMDSFGQHGQKMCMVYGQMVSLCDSQVVNVPTAAPVSNSADWYCMFGVGFQEVIGKTGCTTPPANMPSGSQAEKDFCANCANLAAVNANGSIDAVSASETKVKDAAGNPVLPVDACGLIK